MCRIDRQRFRVDLRLTKDRARLPCTGFDKTAFQNGVCRNGGFFRAEVCNLCGRGGRAVGPCRRGRDSQVVGHANRVIIILCQLIEPAATGLNRGQQIAAHDRHGNRRTWVDIAAYKGALLQISQGQDVVTRKLAHGHGGGRCNHGQGCVSGGCADVARAIDGLGKDQIGPVRQHDRRRDPPRSRRSGRTIPRCRNHAGLAQ